MLKKFEYDCNNEDAFGIRFGRKMHIWNPDYIQYLEDNNVLTRAVNDVFLVLESFNKE